MRLGADKLPGGVWNDFFSDKFGAFGIAAPIAEKVMGLIHSGEIWDDRSSYTLGARGRRQKRGDDVSLFSFGGNIESRMIMMPDFVSSIVALCFSQPLMDALRFSQETRWSWNKIGYSHGNQNFLDLGKYHGLKDTFEGDWANFDSGVPVEVIRAAFAVLFSCFGDSPE